MTEYSLLYILKLDCLLKYINISFYFFHEFLLEVYDRPLAEVGRAATLMPQPTVVVLR